MKENHSKGENKHDHLSIVAAIFPSQKAKLNSGEAVRPTQLRHRRQQICGNGHDETISLQAKIPLAQNKPSVSLAVCFSSLERTCFCQKVRSVIAKAALLMDGHGPGVWRRSTHKKRKETVQRWNVGHSTRTNPTVTTGFYSVGFHSSCETQQWKTQNAEWQARPRATFCEKSTRHDVTIKDAIAWIFDLTLHGTWSYQLRW